MKRSDVVQVTPPPRLTPLTEAEVAAWLKTRTAEQVRALIALLEEALVVEPPPLVISNPPWLGVTINPPALQVELQVVGPQRLAVLQLLRRVQGLGLREAKALADSVPVVIMEHEDWEQSRRLAEALEALGAQVAVR